MAGIKDGPVEEFRYSDVVEKTYFTVIKPTLAYQGNYRYPNYPTSPLFTVIKPTPN